MSDEKQEVLDALNNYREALSAYHQAEQKAFAAQEERVELNRSYLIAREKFNKLDEVKAELNTAKVQALNELNNLLLELEKGEKE